MVDSFFLTGFPNPPMIGNSIHFKIRHEYLICLMIVITTCYVYRQVINHSFVTYDDGLYITENYRVQGGLTLENFFWSFSTHHAGNWHPLTWLSHMLDVEIFGLNAGGHHLTSVFIHTLNSLLVFLVFRRMTGEIWQSGFVAALFALHPLHVESVAWVSERKDVLSTFFGLLALWSYSRYAAHSAFKWKWYLAALLFFIMGLMSKPMMVTLPFALLLLDYWPLERLQLKKGVGPDSLQSRSTVRSLILEKLPFLGCAALSSAITVLAQQGSGFLGTVKIYPLILRIANAVVSYENYIFKMLWPFHLSVFYPYPFQLPLWNAIGIGLGLLCVSMLVILVSSKQPWHLVGWFWYLGMLVPVIGLVQVGAQAMADRYTYVPSIGLFIMVAWGVPHLFSRWRYKILGMILGASVILLICTTAASFQTSIWANSITLFKHALKVTENNALAHNMLAYSLSEKGELNEAVRHIYAGLKIQPVNAGAYNNLGNIRMQQGQIDEAIRHFKKALQINPVKEGIHYNLANALMAQGKTVDAIGHYDVALDLNPDNVNYRNNLANALVKTGRIADALHHYSLALRHHPNDPEICNNLGVALMHAGKSREAVKLFETALQLKPGYLEARQNLHKALKIQ